MHIGIFGHYGNRNLGDEAIIEAAISSVARHFDNPRITCFSIVPEDTAERHGVVAYPIVRRNVRPVQSAGAQKAASCPADRTTTAGSPASRARAVLKHNALLRYPYRVAAGCLALLRELRAELPFLTSCYHRLKPIDLLIVAGSNQFLDNFGGPAGFPLTLLKWTILCKLSGTRIAFVSVGAGPIYSPLSKRLIRTSLFFADYRSYRDAASRQLIEGDTGRPKGELFPDLASNLSFRAAARKRATTDKPTVGINPMPMYDRRYWHETDDGKYGAYVEKLAMLAARLMADGYPVFFFGTQPKDYNVIDDIVPRLPAVDAGATTLVRDATSVQELMTVICGADIVVATRFHGTVLPLVAGVPVLGICYYRKAADLMREMGQEEYFVMLDDFEVDEVYEKYRLLEANLDTERRKIEQASRRNRERLERQYEHLASVFVGRASSGGKARHAGYRLRRILSRT